LHARGPPPADYRLADPSRFAAIEEIAAVVLFLLSDASGYIVGETINVNGGSYLD
jgi:NAD(P)-dependent dehydrogenase (short-subunit alcohol dehydrogenase family)